MDSPIVWYAVSVVVGVGILVAFGLAVAKKKD